VSSMSKSRMLLRASVEVRASKVVCFVVIIGAI
jgi:hypothetical protein